MERAEAPEVAIDALPRAEVAAAAVPAAAWVDAAIPAAPALCAATEKKVFLSQNIKNGIYLKVYLRTLNQRQRYQFQIGFPQQLYQHRHRQLQTRELLTRLQQRRGQQVQLQVQRRPF